jgi:hypothetical protein
VRILELSGKQILQTFGGVIHVQNSLDIEADNTGFDIVARPNGTYAIYDGNGRLLPILFKKDGIILNVDTIEIISDTPVELTNVNIAPTFPKRVSKSISSVVQIAPNSTYTFLAELDYPSISLQKLSANKNCSVRLYPNTTLAALDPRLNSASLINVPPANCALINQVTLTTDNMVWVSAQSIGMTDNSNTGQFAVSITNNDVASSIILLDLFYLALEPKTNSIVPG